MILDAHWLNNGNSVMQKIWAKDKHKNSSPADINYFKRGKMMNDYSHIYNTEELVKLNEDQLKLSYDMLTTTKRLSVSLSVSVCVFVYVCPCVCVCVSPCVCVCMHM